MNKMKQLAFVIIGFIVAAIVIALLLGYTKNDIQRQVDNNNEKSLASVQQESTRKESSMVFLSITKNSSDSTVKGFLINENGKRSDFTLTSKDGKFSSDEDIFKAAEKKYASSDAADYFSEGDIQNICALAKDIDSSKKCERNRDLDDLTTDETTTIYAVRESSDKTALIKICSYGAAAESPTDGNSKSIQKVFVRKNKSASSKASEADKVSAPDNDPETESE